MHSKANQVLRAACALSLAGFSACATPEATLSGETVYRKSMVVALSGETGAQGVQVAPFSPAVTLNIYTPQKPKFVRLTTCHREVVFREPGKRWSYEYRPVALERGYCIMEIAAFDSDGDHSWHMIDWRTDESLTAQVECSGEVRKEKGVSVCQARSGLLQALEYTRPVSMPMIEGDRDQCPAETENNKRYTYVMPSGKCLLVFADENGAIHRHTAFGYTEVRTE
jgi:hypothetical protein